MMFHFFSKKSAPERHFDPDREKPIIRASICTGEKVAGFKDRQTGVFREVQLIRTAKDLDEFKKAYGIGQIDTEY